MKKDCLKFHNFQIKKVHQAYFSDNPFKMAEQTIASLMNRDIPIEECDRGAFCEFLGDYFNTREPLEDDYNDQGK